ncbi:MAG: family 1 glycosylhydrolase [Caulobacteraceae bacterium]|nr:family 1 glycosylhydrolase [Caulobacteraceae bacterium]
MFDPVTAGMDRRSLLAAALAPALIIAKPAAAGVQGGAAFPAGFLWGASTAGHQVEGSNVSADCWVLENVRPTLFRQHSGDACDSYNRFEEDIALLAGFGLNTYRFSLEWARIEPEPNLFSNAQLAHYDRMLQACRRHGVRAAVTFNHNTAPAWFAAQGGWTNPEAAALFARFCSVAARSLARDMSLAFTLNEPQVNQVLRPVPGSGSRIAWSIRASAAMNAAAAKAVGSDRFSTLLDPDIDRLTPQLLAAHEQGFAAIKAERSDLPVGVCLAVIDFQPSAPGVDVEPLNRAAYGDWFEAASRVGDLVGVQVYNRVMVGPGASADQPAPSPALPDPQALGAAVSLAHAGTGRPVLVTENGLASADDAPRIAYIDAALSSLAGAIGEGVPVLGYIHWSLLDNFEWLGGYGPKFGLVAVDLQTFLRTPKPSAFHLGAIARRNALQP